MVSTVSVEGRERVSEFVCVCERERESVCERVCVREREREEDRGGRVVLDSFGRRL